MHNVRPQVGLLHLRRHVPPRCWPHRRTLPDTARAHVCLLLLPHTVTLQSPTRGWRWRGTCCRRRCWQVGLVLDLSMLAFLNAVGVITVATAAACLQQHLRQ